MLFGSSHVGTILAISSLVLFLIYKYFKRNSDYWQKRNVPGPSPKFFFGNVWDSIILKGSFGTILQKIHSAYKEPFVGVYAFDEPGLLIRDPEIIKHILVKDFIHFQNRVICAPAHNEMIRSLLFFSPNPDWKHARDKLTSVFSSAKMKNIFHIMKNVCDELIHHIESAPAVQNVESFSKKYSTELVTQAFYGVRSQCFEREDAEFYTNAKSLFGGSVRNALFQSIYFYKSFIVSLLKLDFYPPPAQKFFRDVFWQCLRNTQKLEEKPNNLISILGDLHQKDPYFDGDRLVAQGMMFFAAGTETTSAAISFFLYELCMNPAIQENLRSEITNAINDKGLNYESVKEMTYLDMCLQETLRKYPVMPFLDRKCSSPYKIPGTDVVIEKDIAVYISVTGIHYDEKYYPEPEKFIPERFLNNPNNAGSLIYFPFGFGPRFCIGDRFALLGTKLAMIHILTNFSVSKASDTPSSIEFDPRNLTLLAKGGLPLKFEKLN